MGKFYICRPIFKLIFKLSLIHPDLLYMFSGITKTRKPCFREKLHTGVAGSSEVRAYCPGPSPVHSPVFVFNIIVSLTINEIQRNRVRYKSINGFRWELVLVD